METDSGRRKVSRPIALVRMLLIVVVLILFIYFLWRGGILALLAWLATIIVLVDTSVNVLFAMYGEPGSRRLGFMYWLFSVFLGAQGTFVVTREGKVLAQRPAGPLASIFARMGGPGRVIIENGVAVVFERGGKYTQVRGPGVVWIRRHERVAKVIDLRRQVRSRAVHKVMTRDGLGFDLERLDVLFDLAADFNPQRGEYSFSEQAMLDLVYSGGVLYDKGEEVEWGTRVLAIVEYHLRNVAAGYNLIDLVTDQQGNPRTNLLQKVEEAARPALRQYGVRLFGIDIGQIVIPEEMRDYLRLPLRKEKIISISEGLQKAIDKINLALRQEMGEVRPHLLLSLTDTLGRILEESLRLTEPSREGVPTGLLPSGGETPGQEPEAK